MNKKKYSILLLVLLFTICLGLFSTIYAVDLTPVNEMNYDIAMKIFDYLKENNSFASAYGGNQSNYLSFYNSLNDDKVNEFVNRWNNAGLDNYVDYIEQCIFISNGWENHNYLQVIFNNNTIGNNLNHVQVYQRNNNVVEFNNINDNHARQNLYRWGLELKSDGTLSGGTSVAGPLDFYQNRASNSSINIVDDTFINIPCVFSYGLNQSIYFNDNWYRTLMTTVIIRVPTQPDTPDVPDNPDDPGTDDPGTGGGSSVDLSATNNKIDNVKNEVQQQGQAIVGAIENQTEKIDQGNQISQEIKDYLTEEANGEEQQEFIEDSINDIQDSLNEQLSNSEIFGALEFAESGFIDLILGEPRRFSN